MTAINEKLIFQGFMLNKKLTGVGTSASTSLQLANINQKLLDLM